MKVHTKLGLIDLEKLEVEDHVEYHDNARVIATEWWLDGEMVRRDVWASVLRGLSTEVAGSL